MEGLPWILRYWEGVCGWTWHGLFSEFLPRMSSAIINKSYSTFLHYIVQFWHPILLIDRSSPRLLFFLRRLPDFHFHRRRHYHCLMNPYHLVTSSTLSFPLPLTVQSICHGISTASAINELVIPTATRPNPLYDPKSWRPRKPTLVMAS